ncbi:MAG TPA: four helix bundle protein [Gemmatimonadaceae bacterium]|nr:four helix bundle protein [Gemmatimonadaceae bacterium]
MTDFRKLKVWQKAHAMTLDVHRIAGQIRGSKHAALRSQMIRAAMSVPANIVEGSSQLSAREFSRFLRIALNSTTELEYHLLAARDLANLPASESVTLVAQVVEIRKMIYGLLRYLASRTVARSEHAPTPPPTTAE